jgi:hypothetical protein
MTGKEPGTNGVEIPRGATGLGVRRVLLDLDEVLADWVGGACRAWGLDPAAAYAEWPPGEYGITPALGRALAKKLRPYHAEPDVLGGTTRGGLPVGEPAFTEWMFWSRINGRQEFWEELKPLPWCHALINLAAHGLGVPWYVVTRPGACAWSSMAGKAQWVARVLGPGNVRRLNLTYHKELFAGPGVLLIDDHEDNVEAFQAAGGLALLFPRHHNKLHTRAHDPMAFIRDALGVPAPGQGVAG